jgi:hypothetical protein
VLWIDVVNPKLFLSSLAGIGLAWLLVPGVAAADEPVAGTGAGAGTGAVAGAAVVTTKGWKANAAQQRIGLDYDLWPVTSLVTMAWGVNGHVKITDNVFLDDEYAWSYLAATGFGGGEQLAYGNPTIGAHYVRSLEEQVKNLRMYVGGAVTFPVLNDPAPEVALTASRGGSSRAAFDLARLSPYYMAFRINAGAEYRILPQLYYRGDLDPVIYVPTNGKLNADPELILEQSNEIEYRPGSGLGGGLRLQEAFTLTNTDLVQTALEPFVAYTPAEEGLYGRLGLLVALDEGAGFGFDKNKLAVVKLSIGYQLK